jgi:hypothetical protein
MTILMLAPAASKSYVCSSTNVYVSDNNCVVYITNGSAADQADLIAAGLSTLVPTAAASLVAASGGNVDAVTTAALPSCVYANGTNGVGATLTGSANGALSAQDGVTLTANQRLLVRRQVDMTQNGLYKVTTVGTGGTKFVLTRATDADEASELTNILITAGGGSTLSGRRFMLPLPQVSIVIGSSNLPFVAAD